MRINENPYKSFTHSNSRTNELFTEVGVFVCCVQARDSGGLLYLSSVQFW